MAAIAFSISGSASEPYRLVFRKSDDRVIAFCDCSGYRFGGFCKHVVSLMRGEETKGLLEGIENLPVLVRWVAESDLPEILAGIDKQEKIAAAAKRKATKLKTRLKNMICLEPEA